MPDYRADNPIYKRSTDESKILGQITNFASFLSSNVDDSGNNFEPFGKAQKRKAVEVQWNAIVMVEDEIHGYRPQYLWGTDEIREALRASRARQSGLPKASEERLQRSKVQPLRNPVRSAVPTPKDQAKDQDQ